MNSSQKKDCHFISTPVPVLYEAMRLKYIYRDNIQYLCQSWSYCHEIQVMNSDYTWCQPTAGFIKQTILLKERQSRIACSVQAGLQVSLMIEWFILQGRKHKSIKSLFTFIFARNVSMLARAVWNTSEGRSYQTLRHRSTCALPSLIPKILIINISINLIINKLIANLVRSRPRPQLLAS